ncbi:MAG: STAS-like domain-containing protein [Eubacterium sp.]|nr:STAS-like domain-containing protein [Eubacterium sp.]
MFNNKEKTSWSNNPVIDEQHKSTTVDFQLDLNKKTDIKKALKSIGDFYDFDIRIEDMKRKNSDALVYRVIQNAKDLGTRPAGKAVRIDVLNTIIRTKQPITLDFSEIEIVGSSFIDEFIGIMYVELGSVKFNQLINIVNMNEEVVHLCNRAIAMRIKQALD